jgi:hypothetical protein
MENPFNVAAVGIGQKNGSPFFPSIATLLQRPIDELTTITSQ